MSSVQILATIQSLESQLALLKSMVQGSASLPKATVEAKAPKPKTKKVKDEEPSKEKKPMSEGVRLWNVLIAETLEQMKVDGWTHPETGKPATRKDAMAAASAAKKSSPPSPSKAAKAPSVASGEESGAESDGKKKGPKKGSHWSPETKAAAAAKRAAKKASAAPLPASPMPELESDGEEDEMVKTIISGKTFFINARTNAAYRDGSYEGVFDGSKINTEAAEPL
jgi:hypothetical protein